MVLESKEVKFRQAIVDEIEHVQNPLVAEEDVHALRGWRLIDLARDWRLLALLVAIVFGVVVFGSA
jgi:hypothetical protein